MLDSRKVESIRWMNGLGLALRVAVGRGRDPAKRYISTMSY